MKYGRPIYAAKDLLYWKRLESDQRSWWPLEPEGPRYYITDMEVYRVFLTTHGMAGTLRMRLPHAASTYACGVAARVDGGTAMSCPFLSSVLDSPAAPGGCYSGNVTVQQFVARFAWSARGAIRWAPTLDGLDIFSLHFNRACKFLLCQPVMCQSLTVLSPEIQRCCEEHADDSAPPPPRFFNPHFDCFVIGWPLTASPPLPFCAPQLSSCPTARSCRTSRG